jgi:acyl-CoA synthetase (NDP forming)
MIEANYSRYQAAGKPVVFSILGGEAVEQSLNTLRKKRAPVFDDVYEAVSCLGASYAFRTYRLNQADHVDRVEIDTAAIDAIVDGALNDGRSFLLAHEALQVMESAGVPMPQSTVCRTLEAAVKRAEAIGYPVVMKVVSRDILHKSDAGGVALDLENREEVIDAYQAIMHNSRAYRPDAAIEGVEVSEMVQPGVEVIIGARRDLTFGPIVMFGLGGIYVEVMKDVAFRALPLNRQTVLGMMEQIRSYPLLLGVRGEEQKDIEQVVDTILKLAAIIQNCHGITDIEINPLMVYEQGQGVKAVDARVLVANTERGN